jgi:hypothetical protein
MVLRYCIYQIEDNEFLSGYRTGAFQAADDIKHHREPQSASQVISHVSLHSAPSFARDTKLDTATKCLTRYLRLDYLRPRE